MFSTTLQRSVLLCAQTKISHSIYCYTKLLNSNNAKRLYTISSIQNIKEAHVFNRVDDGWNTRHASTDTDEIILKSPHGEITVPHLSISEYIFKDCDRWAEKPAVTCGATGRTYTFAELQKLIQQFAAVLLVHFNLKPGETVALIMPNTPEYMFVIHGALSAGLIATFVNPLYTPDEIKRQLKNAGTKLIVTISALINVAKIIEPDLEGYKGTIVIDGKDDLNNKIYEIKGLLNIEYNIQLPKVNPNETAILPYSSGTTGLPKGVQLTHKNLIANLVQGAHKDIMDYNSTIELYQEKAFSVLPFFHIYGFNGIMNISLAKGIHVITLPKFTPEMYVEALTKYKPEHLFVVPSLLLFLSSHPLITKEQLSCIRSVMSGAAPLTQSLIEKFKIKLGKDDVLIRQGYGMTESSPVTLISPLKIPPSKHNTCGQLYPSTEAKIIDLGTGKSLGPYKSGELLVRGPQVMIGYWNNEKATKETIDDDKWLHTGDVAYYDDDHYFYIVDRTKELIKVKGNQVSPTELENILLEIPGVADAAVVGVPDTLADEIPCAFVVRHSTSHDITEQEILNYINPKVTHYKKLTGGVFFIDLIPRNAAGKILRNELKVLRRTNIVTSTK